jgi:hypothetical protein
LGPPELIGLIASGFWRGTLARHRLTADLPPDGGSLGEWCAGLGAEVVSSEGGLALLEAGRWDRPLQVAVTLR